MSWMFGITLLYHSMAWNLQLRPLKKEVTNDLAILHVSLDNSLVYLILPMLLDTVCLSDPRGQTKRSQVNHYAASPCAQEPYVARILVFSALSVEVVHLSVIKSCPQTTEMGRTIRAEADLSCNHINKMRLCGFFKDCTRPIHQIRRQQRLFQEPWRGNVGQRFQGAEHVRTSAPPRVTIHHPDRDPLVSEALLLWKLAGALQLWPVFAPLPGPQQKGQSCLQQTP